MRTKFGTFREILYYDGQRESIAIVMGAIGGGEDVLCRVHSHCIGAHVFNSVECDCREQMEAAQEQIQRQGRGVIIWLDQEGKGNGHLALIESMKYKKEFGQAEAYVRAGFTVDARNYRPAVEILDDLKVSSIVMLASNPEKADDLRRDGVVVAGVMELNQVRADG